jgi:hypothetical protein
MSKYETQRGTLIVVDVNTFAREAVSVLGAVHVTTGCFDHELQVQEVELRGVGSAE